MISQKLQFPNSALEVLTGSKATIESEFGVVLVFQENPNEQKEEKHFTVSIEGVTQESINLSQVRISEMIETAKSQQQKMGDEEEEKTEAEKNPAERDKNHNSKGDDDMSRNLPLMAETTPMLHREFPYLFWCHVGYCCCGGYKTCFENPMPCSYRSLECFVNCYYYNSGLYPGGVFNRAAVEKLFSQGGLKMPEEFAKICKQIDLHLTREEIMISNSKSLLNVNILLYKPLAHRNMKRVLIYLHGGGWVTGHNFSKCDDMTCMLFADRGYVVLNVEYRLSPENPLPAALWDVYETVKWAKEAYPDYQLVLGGTSAGGNLAIVTASLCRDQLNPDLQPSEEALKVDGCLLLCPVVGMELYVGNDHKTSSWQFPFLDRSALLFYYEAYLGSQNVAQLMRSERRFNPFLAGFHNMPATLMVSASMDYLQHENKLAVELLTKQLGVGKVSHFHYENKPHAFFALDSFDVLASVMFRCANELDALIPRVCTNETLEI